MLALVEYQREVELWVELTASRELNWREITKESRINKHREALDDRKAFVCNARK